MSRYELRILSGCHAGASAPIDRSALIGSDLDSDIILADDGLPDAAQKLDVSKKGWSLSGGDVFAFNQPERMGPVWITVAMPTQRWPKAPLSATTVHPQEEREPQASAWDADLKRDAENDTRINPLISGMTESDSSVSQEKWRHKHFFAVVLVAGVIGLPILFAVWRPGVSTAEISNVRTPVKSDEKTADLIRQALQQLGQDKNVHIIVSDQGPVRIQGWVSTVSERDAIAEAMTRIWPMPALQLYIHDDILKEIRYMLTDHPGYHEVSILDEHIRLEGIALDIEQKARLINRIQTRYADLPLVTDRYVVTDTIRDVFSSSLRTAGLHDDVPLQWDSSFLQADVQALSLWQQDIVRQQAAELNKMYWGRLSIRGPGSTEPQLPFTIRSVVSGPHPYIVLPGGEKLLKGGAHQGYRLTAIESNRLTFQGDHEIVVPR